MSRLVPSQYPIVVIDDEEAIRFAIDTALRIGGYNSITTFSDGSEALRFLKSHGASVVLLDLNMPHQDGESLLPQILAILPEVPVIVITGTIDVETAVRCMKAGAFDYIVKPVDNNRLFTAISQALKFQQLHQENEALRQHLLDDDLAHPEAFSHIITQSSKMLTLFRYCESIAGTEQPVLVRGETGSGKELMAQAIHSLSGRKGEFVAVNVAGLDDSVFSDTLFGHVKGAFTGADTNRPGLIERASGGTLFLDEIGDLNQFSQVKLLRLLQEEEYMPLGEDAPRRSDARIIASTHADLWELQHTGEFRQDLHYRLRTHRVWIPPLRERKEDLVLLVNHFLEKAGESLGKEKPELESKLVSLLETYSYPGNVRELMAMVFDALAQEKGDTLSLEPFRVHMERSRNRAIPMEQAGMSRTSTLRFPEKLPTIKEATRLLVEEAMERSEGKQSHAAKLLGISQQALSKRLKAWNSED